MVLGNIILMNWYYQTRIKLDIKYFWKNIFSLIPAVILSIAISFGFSLILAVNSILHFLIIGILYVCVYIILLYSMGMNEYEKNLIKVPINKILRRN